MQNFTRKYVIGVVAVLVVLGAVIVATWPDKQDTKPTSHKPNSSQTAKAPPSSNTEPSQSAPAPTQPAPNGTTAPGSKQLTDTGPGETVALFVASSLFFAALHWLYVRQRTTPGSL